MSEHHSTAPDLGHVWVPAADIIKDLRSELAFAKHAADYWKKRADELETVVAKAKETR